MTYALQEHEEKLRRLARMLEYTPTNSSSSKVPGLYDSGLNEFAKEMALAQSPIESLLRQSNYKSNPLAALLKSSKSLPSQISGDGASLDSTLLKGKSVSYVPKGTYSLPGDGASLVYTQPTGTYDLGKSTYAQGKGTYGPKGGYAPGTGGKGGYAGAGSGGKGSGKGGSSSSSGSSGGSSGGSGGGGK